MSQFITLYKSGLFTKDRWRARIDNVIWFHHFSIASKYDYPKLVGGLYKVEYFATSDWGIIISFSVIWSLHSKNKGYLRKPFVV